MSYHIRYTPAAQKDMDDVRESVLESSKSFDIAGIYVAEFADTVAEKREFPESGIPLYYRGLFTGFYSVNFMAYKAFYRLNAGYVEVIRVILSKRGYLKILFGERG